VALAEFKFDDEDDDDFFSSFTDALIALVVGAEDFVGDIIEVLLHDFFADALELDEAAAEAVAAVAAAVA